MANGVAHVNTVQPQQGKAGREGSGRVAVGLYKNLAQCCASGQLGVCTLAPVVEVACHDEWGMHGNIRTCQLAQHVQLLVAVRLTQAQMHADGMHINGPARYLQLAVQQAASLGPADGHVMVFKTHNRELRQNSIAMVAVCIDSVAAIGKLRPDAVCQKFVVGGFRVVVEFVWVPGVAACDLLQKHHVSTHATHRLAQFGQDEFAVKKREPLVDIDREHLERERHGSSSQRLLGLGQHICV